MNKETDLTYLSSLNQKIGKTQEMIIELQQENKQLKERINKAIEYIETYDEYEDSVYDLLEILKGDSNE